jgi:PAS domain S-box-containing protein
MILPSQLSGADFMSVNLQLSSRPFVGEDPLQKRALLWSVLGLGMLVLIGLIAAWTLRQIRISDSWVDHTREVIRNTEEILANLKDAESAQRGYILTGQETYLETYQTAAAKLPSALSALRRLTGDNSGQQERLNQFEPLLNERITGMAETVAARQQLGFEAAEKIIAKGQGKNLTDHIQQLQEIEREEYRLLQERLETRKSRLWQGFAATLLASLLALLALIAFPLDVRGAVRQRNLAQRQQQESQSTAQALFEAAAQSIFIVDREGRIVMANPSTEKMFGYRVADLLGQPVELLLPESLRAEHVGHRDHYFSKPQNRPMGLGLDLQARRKDGTEFFAEISLSYINTAGGTLAVAFVSDISKRRSDAQAIRQQREELRGLARRLMTAQDDERRRIARDLHDDLSQQLAYLAIDLGKLAIRPAPEEFTSSLRPLQRRAAEAAESVRQISHRLHPSILDDIGLTAALEQYCEEFEQAYGIATRFTSRNLPDTVGPEIAGSIYHIAQECLRNVAKHSQTATVLVTIEGDGSVLRLTVKDEGIGLNPTQLPPGAGIGIVGMRERAHLVNGSVSIESQSGAGTEVRVEVPLAVSSS